jgi:hypothetical protein
VENGIFSNQPDLQGARYGEGDLEAARGVFRDLFSKLGIEEWTDNPVGPLRLWWTQQGVQTTCYLIYLARIFYVLTRNVTSRSEPILYDKIRRLFAEIDEDTYKESLAELEVAYILGHAMSPISLEPLVPADRIGTANQPVSPDFGIRLPDGDIAIEVTVWHWQAMRDWDAASSEISRRLAARLRRAGLSRQLRLGLPLHVRPRDIETIASSQVVDNLRPEGAGRIEIELSNGVAELEWTGFTPISAHSMIDQDSLMIEGFGMGAIGEVAAFGSLFGFAWHPILDEAAFHEAVKSLRKALDRKRRQAVDGLPNILALGLGHHRLEWDMVWQIIVDTIWPNPKYRWISAIAGYTPERAWEHKHTTALIDFQWNPNAAMPAPQALRDVVERGATHHLPGRRD